VSNRNNHLLPRTAASTVTTSCLWTRFDEDDEENEESASFPRGEKTESSSISSSSHHRYGKEEDGQDQKDPEINDHFHVNTTAFALARRLHYFSYVLCYNIQYCLYIHDRPVYSLLDWKATTAGWYLLFGGIAGMGLALPWKLFVSRSLSFGSRGMINEMIRSSALFCSDFVHGGWFLYTTCFRFLKGLFVGVEHPAFPNAAVELISQPSSPSLAMRFAGIVKNYWCIILPLLGLWTILTLDDMSAISRSDIDTDGDDKANPSSLAPQGKDDDKEVGVKVSQKVISTMVSQYSVLALLCSALDHFSMAVIELTLLFLIKLPATVLLSAVFWIRLHLFGGEYKYPASLQRARSFAQSFQDARFRISTLGLSLRFPNGKAIHLVDDLPATNTILWGPLKEELQFRFLFWTFLTSLGVGQGAVSSWVLFNSLLFGVFHIGNYFPLSEERQMAWMPSLLRIVDAYNRLLADSEHNESSSSSSSNDVDCSDIYPKCMLASATGHCLQTALLAQYILNPLYLNRGFAAAFGAHVGFNGTIGVYKRLRRRISLVVTPSSLP